MGKGLAAGDGVPVEEVLASAHRVDPLAIEREDVPPVEEEDCELQRGHERADRHHRRVQDGVEAYSYVQRQGGAQT